MSGRVMIVGTGNVGASIAFALLNQRTPVSELILTDIDMADAEGEAMDLSDALALAPSWLKIRAGHYFDAKTCDICVLAAGANQKPGETRTSLVQKNAKITKSVVEQIMQSGFKGIFVVVTNPVDTMAYLTWKVSGLSPDHIVGSGTILDSARLRFKLSELLKVNPKSVHAFQIGEHGDSEFTLWSNASIGGENIASHFSAARRAEIQQFVRDEAYTIIEKKGATHYGIGVSAVQIISCILGDERRVLPVSSYDDCSDTFYGYPAILGKKGIIRRLELDLTESEAISLQKSINAIEFTKSQIKGVLCQKPAKKS